MSMTLEQAIRILNPVGEGKCATDDEFFEDLDQVEPALLLACEVLQREVERQAGCDWCINGAELTTGFLSDSDITPLQGLSGSTTYALRVGAEYRKINFCPMCGKPLNDGKVDGDG